MDDFRKQAEEARLARIQGIRLRPSVEQSQNRIEEALGRQPISNSQFPISNENSSNDNSLKIAKLKSENSRGYSRFLKKFFLRLGIVVLLAVVGFGGYATLKTRSQVVPTSDQIIQAVGKLVELPQGQKPTVATVTDLKPLAGQEFFKDAQVGDKVLVFGDTQKAILYRPSTGKIIQVAPIGQ